MSLFCVVYVLFFVVVGVIFGIVFGGMMVFCKLEGLIVLDQLGLCFVSDIFREVLVFFVVLGVMVGMMFLVVWMVVWLFVGGGKK